MCWVGTAVYILSSVCYTVLQSPSGADPGALGNVCLPDGSCVLPNVACALGQLCVCAPGYYNRSGQCGMYGSVRTLLSTGVWFSLFVLFVLNQHQNLRIEYDQRKSFTVAYYPDIVLMQEMLSFTGAIAVVTPTSSSKTVCTSCTSDHWVSVKLRSSSVRTYGSPIAPIFILLLITYEAWCRIVGIRHQFKMRLVSDNAWLTLGVASRQALWAMPLMNGVSDFRPKWMKREAILNTCCNTGTLLCRNNWIIFRLCTDNV